MSDFHDLVLDDADLNKFFKNVSMAKLINHQIDYISSALGNPKTPSGRIILEAHRNLPITDQDFYRVMGYLSASLVKNGFEPDDINTIEKLVFSLKPQIVSL